MKHHVYWLTVLSALMAVGLAALAGCPAPQDESPATQSPAAAVPAEPPAKAVSPVAAVADDAAVETTLAVAGMTCQSCEQAIQAEVGKLAGVSAVKADHAAGTVLVSYRPGAADLAAVGAAIEKLGYTVGEPAAEDEAAVEEAVEPPAAEDAEAADETPAATEDNAAEAEPTAATAAAGCEDCDGGECSGACVEEETVAEPETAAAGDEAVEAADGDEGGCGSEAGCASCAQSATGTAPAEVPAGLTRVTLRVEGMTCVGKAGWVGKTIGGLEGVAGCYADQDTLTAVIDCDPAMWDADGLVAEIEQRSQGVFTATQV